MRQFGQVFKQALGCDGITHFVFDSRPIRSDRSFNGRFYRVGRTIRVGEIVVSRLLWTLTAIFIAGIRVVAKPLGEGVQIACGARNDTISLNPSGLFRGREIRRASDTGKLVGIKPCNDVLIEFREYNVLFARFQFRGRADGDPALPAHDRDAPAILDGAFKPNFRVLPVQGGLKVAPV